MMQLRSLLTFCFFLLFTINGIAQNKPSENKSPVLLEATYIGDALSNFSGGMKKGFSYLGLANLNIGFDTEVAGLWNGGAFFINAANAHGGDPTADLIGDFHTVSNIEADELTYIHELWFRQTFKKVEFVIGLQDLGTDFVSSEYGSMYINSTFGTPSTIADNVPSPIFPLTAFGFSFKWTISDLHRLKLAVFDGLPAGFSHNPYNLNWSIKFDEGLFAVSEYQHLLQPEDGLIGSYRAGVYYHYQGQIVSEDTNLAESYNHNYGIYIIADQEIFNKPDNQGGIGLFAQIAISPGEINTHNRYFGLGLLYEGLLNNRSEDQLGIAFTYAGFRDHVKKDETVIEISYKAILSENIYVQPDLQYVISPAGTDRILENAFIGILRFGLNF